jgi:hypothetical protein
MPNRSLGDFFSFSLFHFFTFDIKVLGYLKGKY